MSLSALGKEWVYIEPHQRDVTTVIQQHNIDPLTAQLVLNRCSDITFVEHYIQPTIKHLLKNPSLLKDLDQATQRVFETIQKKQKIAIYADYDVDGATSSALLRKFFQELNIETTLYIPDRIDEGYGAHPEALQKLKNEHHDLVILCDCGTTSFKALEHAANIQLDIIVIDHHTAEITLPPCYALINPKRLDQPIEGKESFESLCAAGLVFVFLVGLNRLLRENNQTNLPNLMQYLDIVALGTVADVMPLYGLNRAFVKQGLKLLNQKHNKGLSALIDIAEITDNIQAYHLGFYLGPRINAGGRVGKASLGSELLTTNNHAHAENIAFELNTYNLERQTIESIVLEQAIAIIEKEQLYQHPIILVGSIDWHPGVIGIVASRLKEKFQKPTIVVAFDETGEGKGSGRSLPGIELGELILQAVQKKILLKGGGHAMAIGLTIQRNQWDSFLEFLNQHLLDKIAAYIPKTTVDITLSIPAITIDLVKKLSILEPFGQGNPAPKIRIDDVFIKHIMPVGENHFRIQFCDGAQNTLQAMSFRSKNTPLESFFYEYKEQPFSIVGTIKLDTWNGREKVTFFLEDCMLP